MGEGLQLWNNFVDAFLTEVKKLGSSSDELHSFWGSITGRTDRYLGNSGLLKRIDSKLKLEFIWEYLHIDGCYRDSNGWPQVFVEVENNPNSTLNEIEKLCYVRAPLKILITVSKWPPDKPLKQIWTKNISNSWQWLQESPDTVYGFMIGEAKKDNSQGESLFYHYFSVSATGEVLNGEKEEFIGKF